MLVKVEAFKTHKLGLPAHEAEHEIRDFEHEKQIARELIEKGFVVVLVHHADGLFSTWTKGDF